jgi:hypothetical protein
MKIWTCGISPWNGPQNAWTRIKNENGDNRLSNFWNFFVRRDLNVFLWWLVTVDITWLYHYDPESKQQPMEWRNKGLPDFKLFRLHKFAGKILVFIFWIKMVSSSLIILQRAKLTTGNITHLYLCNWRKFWKKNTPVSLTRRSISCTTTPVSKDTCKP